VFPADGVLRRSFGRGKINVIAATLLAATSIALPGCSLGTAKAEIRSSHVTIPASQSISGEPFRVDPNQADQVLCVRLPHSTVTVMVVTIASGFGTAGIVNWVAFVRGPRGYRVSLVRGGYRLGLARVGTDIVETEPVYRAKDPNCCPTGGFDHRRWHWNGSRFRIARAWHDTRYRP
jgi:hypothetical protein